MSSAKTTSPRRLVTNALSSLGLVGLLLVAFALQQVFHQGARAGLLGTNPLAAAAMGGLEPLHFSAGEAWRLASYALLHADLFHLLFNVLSLALAGFVVEQTWGRVWTPCLFVLGVLGGGAAAVLGGGNTVVIGASGGVLSLVGGALLCTARFPTHAPAGAGGRVQELRWRLRGALLLLAAPAIVPALVSADTNVAGHVGGLLSGMLTGMVAHALCAPDASRARQAWGRRGAAACVVVGVVWLVWGLTRLPESYREGIVQVEWAADLAPQSLVDGLSGRAAGGVNAALEQELEAALTQWPDDPRLLHLRGHLALSRHRVGEAMEMAARGLATRVLRSRAFANGELEASLRVLRLSAAVEAGDAPSVPAELAALCGGLRETAGGGWAAENRLCDTLCCE